MARVSDIIFCLNSTNLPGQGVCANTILTTIMPEYIPGLFTFSVVITILGVDVSTEHPITISFSHEGTPVADVTSQIPSMEDQSNLPQEYKGVNLALNWNNINFQEQGEYSLKVMVDGQEVGNKTIFVKGKNQI